MPGFAAFDPPYLPGAALEASDVSVAEVLKEAGYATGIIGKWGLGETKNATSTGLPSRQGFDFFYGYLTHGHAHNHYPDYLWRNQTEGALPNVVSQNPDLQGATFRKRKFEYAHDLLADEALKFVREHKDEPFFLYLGFTIPHANNEAGDDGMEVPIFGDYANHRLAESGERQSSDDLADGRRRRPAACAAQGITN